MSTFVENSTIYNPQISASNFTFASPSPTPGPILPHHHQTRAINPRCVTSPQLEITKASVVKAGTKTHTHTGLSLRRLHTETLPAKLRQSSSHSYAAAAAAHRASL